MSVLTTLSDDSEVSELLPKAGEIVRGAKDQFEVIKLIDDGEYGAVFEVIRKSDKLRVAMKCELSTIKRKSLYLDVEVLKEAQKLKNRHFCSLVDEGSIDKRFSFLCMKMVGSNMWDLRTDRPDRRFSIGTSLKMAVQSLRTIEVLHKLGYLHRDIKPGNFAIGRKDENGQRMVHILNFGLARKFVDENGDILKERKGKVGFAGILRYAPLAAHKKKDQGTKDDIESWLYMVAEWTSGRLPWNKYTNEENEIQRMKQLIRESPDYRSVFLSYCPAEYGRILDHLVSLTFYHKPDYAGITRMLLKTFPTNNLNFNAPLDWDEEHKYETTAMLGKMQL